MKQSRRIAAIIGFVAALIVIAGVMIVIGRGHTVYFDNKKLEYEGQTYDPPYQVIVYIKGESVAKLKARERGMTTNIGQDFGMALGVTREKGGEQEIMEVSLKLPYSMDGVIINLPAYLAGLPEEAYLSEFVAVPTEADMQDDAPAEDDEMVIDAEL